MHNKVLKTAPAVFTVGRTYQIIIPVKSKCLMWVKVGEELFFDHINGIIRSDTDIHRITVPQEILDKERKYSVCYKTIKKRSPYFTLTEDEVQKTFSFGPISDEAVKAFLIADTHNKVAPAIKAAKCFEEKYGKIDFLILAGDIPEDSSSLKNFNTIFEIADKLTGGQKPIVYANGNHDLRGKYAEKIYRYTPNLNEISYYTFRMGNIWGISLDCAEDKNDNNEEYGHTVCCHQFRQEETKFIEKIIDNAKEEYLADDVKYKIIVSHNPFCEKYEPPFDIESKIYSKWCRLLKEKIKPDIMLCGHLHEIAVRNPEKESDCLTPPCKVVIGTKPFKNQNGENCFIGTGFFFKESEIKFVFTDNYGKEYYI